MKSQRKVAQECWEAAQTKPALLELLVPAGESAEAFCAGYAEACLQDLQLAMERAWEDGEISERRPEQLAFTWGARDALRKKAA